MKNIQLEEQEENVHIWGQLLAAQESQINQTTPEKRVNVEDDHIAPSAGMEKSIFEH